MLDTIDRYFTSTFLKFFVGALIMLGGIAFVAKVMETLKIVMDFKGDSIHVVRYYFLNIPLVISVVTAPALLFAVSYTVATFSRNYELAVILAAGRSFMRLMQPVAIFTFFVSLALLAFNEYVTFPSNFASYHELDIIRGRDPSFHLRGRFNVEMRSGNRFYYMAHFWPYKNEVIGLHLVVLGKTGNIYKIIEAEKGVIHKARDWELEDGSITYFDVNGNFLKQEFFKHMKIDLPEDGKYFRRARKDFDETSIFDLQQYINHFKAAGEDYRKYLVEYYWHFSYPLVCFFTVIIGAIVGSKMRKGAIAASLALSTIVTIVYYLIMFFGKSLGNNGTLPPLLAAWLANIIFLLVTVYMVWKFKK
ncbi:MAG: YjgP/YjgQ family permease [Candidatus Hydrogenedentota bacterium]|nr:MAG: YjgP/YjgQ family permease [Candidatus Hydrogenedentota bacterium]